MAECLFNFQDLMVMLDGKDGEGISGTITLQIKESHQHSVKLTMGSKVINTYSSEFRKTFDEYSLDLFLS